jgi:light-independent protochlorophyllide reductase subunit B
VRAAAKTYGIEALITDDYLEVEAEIARLQPELILGTQMERHIAKRLGIPCAVISAPVHVQDFPARYSPQMGFEGANVIFDTWVHPLVMGLEEHLLTMFREDFEFHDAAGPSHHGAKASARPEAPVAPVEASGGDILASMNTPEPEPVTGEVIWLADAERELKKIPFFVRGKAKRNTEKFAADKGVTAISIDTLYEAKAHYAR